MAQEPDKTASPDVKPEEEMTEEELTALHEAEDFIANFDEKDLEDPDKSKELAEKLKSAKTTIAQKRHYKTKFEETKVTPPAKPVVVPPKPNESKKEISSSERVEFRQDHPELPREVVKEIAEQAAAYGISMEEALKKPLVQKYVKDVLDAADVEDASVAPARHPASGIAEKDWGNATPEEMNAQRLKILHPNG